MVSVVMVVVSREMVWSFYDIIYHRWGLIGVLLYYKLYIYINNYIFRL